MGILSFLAFVAGLATGYFAAKTATLHRAFNRAEELEEMERLHKKANLNTNLYFVSAVALVAICIGAWV